MHDHHIRAHREPAGRAAARVRQAATARGISLVEMLVAAAVAIILLSLGAPSMLQMTLTQEMRATRDELTAALQLAEIEAVRRGRPVVLERKTACSTTPTGAGDWRCGYELYVDQNGNLSRDTGEPVLKDVSLSGTLQLTHATDGTGSLVMSPWGKPPGGLHRFVLEAGSGATAATGTVCLYASARVQHFAGAVSCP